MDDIDTNSEAWKWECFAREVARMPKAKRIDFMKRYAKRHGKDQGEKLRSLAKEQWQILQKEKKNV